MDIKEKRIRDGRLIRALRSHAGLKGEDLARVSSIPLATIRSVETGRRPLHLAHLVALAASTGIDAFWFTLGELREWNGLELYRPSSFEEWQVVKKTWGKTGYQDRFDSIIRATEERSKCIPRPARGVFASLVGAALGMVFEQLGSSSSSTERGIIEEMINATLNASNKQDDPK